MSSGSSLGLDRVEVVEVGPRDGFQMEGELIPTELKVEIIDLLSAAGVPKIEVTSFVSPKVIPQMADAAAVMERISRRAGTLYTALVPNAKGMERAIAAGADAARLVVCATETYNRENVGMSIEESIQDCSRMLQMAQEAGVAVEVVIGVAFGCPFEGRVPEDVIVGLASRFAELGVGELSVADSVGVAHPLSIRRLMARLRAELADVDLSLHLHDTRGLGLANVLAALEVGIATFDSSLGGLGGCPITAASSGNIATEDLVHMCQEMGLATDVDLELVCEASRRMEAFLDRRLPSHVLQAGSRRQLFARAGR